MNIWYLNQLSCLIDTICRIQTQFTALSITKKNHNLTHGKIKDSIMGYVMERGKNTKIIVYE